MKVTKVTAVSGDLLLKVSLGLLIGGAVYFIARKAVAVAGSAAAGAADALNPASGNNLAYRGVNSIGGWLTGDSDFNLGSWLYDISHSEYKP